MKIAQVAPLYESVPPKLYGGTERVVSYLTEELVEMGHEVTLFASGDSETAARLIPACPNSLRLDKSCIDQFAHHYVMLEEVMERAEEFDIIHFHVDYLHFPVSRIMGFPHVTTLHGRLDLPDLVPLYRKYREMPVVSICLDQRKPLCWANWVGNVYHGLPDHLLPGDGSGKYLAFLGRICPEKRVDRAIQIALEAVSYTHLTLPTKRIV